MINQKAGYVTPGSWSPGHAEIKRRERNRDRLGDGRDSGDQKAGVEVQQRARTGFQIRAITKRRSK